MDDSNRGGLANRADGCSPYVTMTHLLARKSLIDVAQFIFLKFS
jgi:hypothetical protein